MADLNLTKTVLSGSAEYTATASTAGISPTGLEPGQIVSFVFDNDFVIDDIIVTGLGPIDAQLNLVLLYPTGHSLAVVTGPGGVPAATRVAGPAAAGGGPETFQLNPYDFSRKLWFRVPKWTALQIQLAEVAAAGSFQVSAVGRG